MAQRHHSIAPWHLQQRYLRINVAPIQSDLITNLNNQLSLPTVASVDAATITALQTTILSLTSKTLLTTTEQSLLLQSNAQLKQLNTKYNTANILASTTNLDTLSSNISTQKLNVIASSVTSQVNAEIKNVEVSINKTLSSTNSEAAGALSAIKSISSVSFRYPSLSPATKITSILTTAAGLKYSTIGLALGFKIPTIPSIPKLPSWDQLKSLVKIPKLSNPLDNIGKEGKVISKLGGMNKIGGFSPTTIGLSSINSAISAATNLTKQVPGLKSLTSNLTNVQEQLNTGTQVGASLITKISSLNVSLDNNKKLASQANITPELTDTITKYKNSLKNV